MSNLPICRITRCRISQFNIHGIDRDFDGTVGNVSNYAICRIIRYRIVRFQLYLHLKKGTANLPGQNVSGEF